MEIIEFPAHMNDHETEAAKPVVHLEMHNIAQPEQPSQSVFGEFAMRHAGDFSTEPTAHESFARLNDTSIDSYSDKR